MPGAWRTAEGSLPGLCCGLNVHDEGGMRMVKIGFIGMGNMGNAILNGLLKTHRPEDMIVFSGPSG